MRYTVKVHLVEQFETDSFIEMTDCIERNCRNGLDCELIDNETEETNWLYAKDFKREETEFYKDLLLEQQEQK